MVKLKFLKDVGVIKKGEIVECTEEEYQIYVIEEGIAELVEEPKEKKEKPKKELTKTAIKELARKRRIENKKQEQSNVVFNYEIYKPQQEITTLEQLEQIIKKNFPTIWFETKACLSTEASLCLKSLNGCPSLILVGNPAGEKTTTASFFYGEKNTYLSDDFTPKSFVTQSAGVSEDLLESVDLLPKLKNKILITPELAPVFEAPRDKLIENFAILTRVLDGEGLNRDAGSHGHRGYSGDWKFGWIGATTPLKASVWNVMGKIGNRLFFLNMRDKNRSDAEFLEMFRGVSYEEKVKECRGAVHSFLNNFFMENPIRSVEWDSEQDLLLLPKIIQYAKFLSRLRASLMTWKGEEKGKYEHSFPIVEEPPRAINALYNFAKGHALINSRKFLKEEDLEVVREIALSSMPYDRFKFLQLLSKHNGKLTTANIISELNCSHDTAVRTMKIMEILGVVTIKSIDVESGLIGRPMNYIEIKPEFVELLPHTQGLKGAIKDLEIIKKSDKMGEF